MGEPRRRASTSSASETVSPSSSRPARVRAPLIASRDASSAPSRRKLPSPHAVRASSIARPVAEGEDLGARQGREQGPLPYGGRRRAGLEVPLEPVPHRRRARRGPQRGGRPRRLEVAPERVPLVGQLARAAVACVGRLLLAPARVQRAAQVEQQRGTGAPGLRDGDRRVERLEGRLGARGDLRSRRLGDPPLSGADER